MSSCISKYEKLRLSERVANICSYPGAHDNSRDLGQAGQLRLSVWGHDGCELSLAQAIPAQKQRCPACPAGSCPCTLLACGLLLYR